MVTSTRWRPAWWVVWAAAMGFADALLVTWWVQSALGMAVCGVALASLILFVAWSIRALP